MSNKSSMGGGGSVGPGSRTRRKMSGERPQPLTRSKCAELIQEMLISTGQRDLFKRLIQTRLAQSTWTYTMRTEYIKYIKEKGVDNVNVARMISDTVPYGLEILPDFVRKEMTEALTNFAAVYIQVDDSLPIPPDTDRTDTTFQYQNRDVKPDPGLGINVATPELSLSRGPSPITIPRPLTPQPPIPVLRPETMEPTIKEEHLLVEEEGDGVSDDDEDDDEEEEIIPRHVDEEEEEELMDV